MNRNKKKVVRVLVETKPLENFDLIYGLDYFVVRNAIASNLNYVLKNHLKSPDSIPYFFLTFGVYALLHQPDSSSSFIDSKDPNLYRTLFSPRHPEATLELEVSSKPAYINMKNHIDHIAIRAVHSLNNKLVERYNDDNIPVTHVLIEITLR
jgi:hypothetical protein